MAVAAYPLFALTDHSNFQWALVAQLIFALIFCNVEGAVPATLAEMFPTSMPFSGIAIGYNLTLGVIGGTAPMVSTWLVAAPGILPPPPIISWRCPDQFFRGRQRFRQFKGLWHHVLLPTRQNLKSAFTFYFLRRQWYDRQHGGCSGRSRMFHP